MILQDNVFTKAESVANFFWKSNMPSHWLKINASFSLVNFSLLKLENIRYTLLLLSSIKEHTGPADAISQITIQQVLGGEQLQEARYTESGSESGSESVLVCEPGNPAGLKAS